ncbi:MAG: DUF6624 domain-containing protein [Pseudomonadota bacterium]
MRFSSEMRAVSLAAVTVLVSCQSNPAQDPPTAAFEPIEFPTKIDGALDEGWEFYVMQYDSCIAQSLSHCEVFERAIKDTYMAQLIASSIVEQKSIEEVSGLTRMEFDAFVELQTKDNDDWLESQIQSSGWFNISDYGVDADGAAFLIVQHSGNVDFQKRVLKVLAPLVEIEETSKSGFALLSDRVALKDGKEQLYGSQGGCSGEGVWTPFPVLSGDINSRRSEMSLEPIEDYAARMSRYC